jgi:hypothetical protein
MNNPVSKHLAELLDRELAPGVTGAEMLALALMAEALKGNAPVLEREVDPVKAGIGHRDREPPTRRAVGGHEPDLSRTQGNRPWIERESPFGGHGAPKHLAMGFGYKLDCACCGRVCKRMRSFPILQIDVPLQQEAGLQFSSPIGRPPNCGSLLVVECLVDFLLSQSRPRINRQQANGQSESG